jgi:3-hydroxyacyl-[acyl-carrier-protein] dehydratase
MFELIRSLQLDGDRATGIAEIAADHPGLADHFPGRPVLPGTWLVELAAQIAGPLAEDGAPGRWAMLAIVRDAKLLAPVELPATVHLEAALVRRDSSLAVVQVVARRGDVLVLRGELAFAMLEATPELTLAARARDERLARWKTTR